MTLAHLAPAAPAGAAVECGQTALQRFAYRCTIREGLHEQLASVNVLRRTERALLIASAGSVKHALHYTTACFEAGEAGAMMSFRTLLQSDSHATLLPIAEAIIAVDIHWRPQSVA